MFAMSRQNTSISICFTVLIIYTRFLEMLEYLQSTVREFVLDWLDILLFPLRGKNRIRNAYIQSGGKLFQIISPESRLTLASSSNHIRDIAQAPNDQLSLHAAAKDILKPEYTMAGFNWHDQRGIEGVGFVRTLRTLLTNQLPKMTPDVRGILERSCTRQLHGKKSLNALGLSKKVVTELSGYAFFGRDRMQDEAFMNAAYYYNEDVLYGAEILRLTPKLIVPIVGAILPFALTRQRIFFQGIVDEIERRLSSTDYDTKHNDVIQWIIDTAPKDKKWSPGRMAFEVMAIWFGSVQGLATTLTFALYNLCSYPEYIDLLREEIEGSAGEAFLIDGEGLPLLDSFLKECSRWTPVESVTARRCALRDFTFSDGTCVKKGEWVSIPVGPMLRDEKLYPLPDTFDGFRFVNPKCIGKEYSTQPEGASKFTDISEHWHVWGVGKITCPGRFFVSYIMKHVFFYVLENYEPSMTSPQTEYTLNWRTLTLPKPGVKITFNPRIQSYGGTP